MRGEVCLGVSAFLTGASLLLLIFAHVGQINTGSVPRGIYMARVDTGAYIDALQATLGPNVLEPLYATNDEEPLQARRGLRTTYDFGLYSYCGRLVDTETHGICSNQTAAATFRPYEILISDIPRTPTQDYLQLTNILIPDTNAFRDSPYLGDHTRAAYYMILIGTILAGLAFFTMLFKHTATLLASTILHVFSALFILVGAAIWTVMIQKANEVSRIYIPDAVNTPLGIEVSLGPGLLLLWAGFAIMTVSIIPSMITCMTYRG